MAKKRKMFLSGIVVAVIVGVITTVTFVLLTTRGIELTNLVAPEIPTDVKQYNVDRILDSIPSEHDVDRLKERTDAEVEDGQPIPNVKIVSSNKWYYIVSLYWYDRTDYGISFNSSYVDFKDSHRLAPDKLSDVSIKFVKIDPVLIKDSLDLYTYSKYQNNRSTSNVRTRIVELKDSYIYTIEYDSTTFGDWGLDDVTTHYSHDISVDRNTGETSIPELSRL